MEERENVARMPEIKVDAIGEATNPKIEESEPVEYGGGMEIDPMDLLAAEDDEATQENAETEDLSSYVKELIDIEDNESLKPGIGEVLDEDKIRTDPTPSESDKPSFDPNEVQPALSSSSVEGGVVKNKSTGPSMSAPRAERDGVDFKPKPDMNKDSLVNKFEVTGFEVEYKIGSDIQSVAIRDYFDHADAAFASVNDNKYLMPMPRGGFKVSTIRNGAPTISYNERQIYNYKNGKWCRT